MAITEAELDTLFERELTDEEILNLVMFPKYDYDNNKELVLNLKKLVKHASYCYGYQKKLNIQIAQQNERIKQLEALLENNNISLPIEEVKDTKDSEVFYDIDELEYAEEVEDIMELENTKEIDITEPLFTGYLREGYKVRMPVGQIIVEDKEGNSKVIANTDGDDWLNNPPPTKVHEVIERDPTHLIVSVTEEQKDGSYMEIKRYELSL